jgi:tRNA threonylcarbamoyladenosine biosynthesis protein TsaB
MKTLYIETSTEKSCIAISDGKTFTTVPLSGGPDLSKRLALEVSILLKENNFQPEQIAVGRGPGSFTGVRVGASLGKALSFGWDIPLIEFCSLKTFIPTDDGPFAVLVDARLGGIYTLTGIIEKGNLIQSSEPRLLSPSELEEELQNIPLLLSPNPLLVEKRIQKTCLEASPKFHTIIGAIPAMPPPLEEFAEERAPLKTLLI